MNVSFGVSLGTNPVLLKRAEHQKFADLVKRLDDYGVTAIGTYDSAFIGGDNYVRSTLIAMATERARVGPRPTNPLTREPQVMASFLATLDSLTDGRAFMDIASGDSAIFNIGFKAATRSRIEDYITCIRDLMATGEGIYQGRPQRVRWASEVVRNRIPISICAEGPKMLHLAGRIGDGVIAGTGLLPEVIQDTIDKVHAGAQAEGRDSEAVEVWFTTRCSLHEDRDTAVENVKASVSSILNHSMRFGLDGKNVPDNLRETVQTYVDGYELYDHVLGSGRNPKRMEELGLSRYAIDRFALAGAPKDWVARIEEIADAGATRLWISPNYGDLDRQIHYMRLFGEQVMPHFT